jgi:hypothetical protein
MESEKIYKVTTEGDCEGRTNKTLGYCTGEISDIKDFYDDRKTYTLRVEEFDVIKITPNSKSQRVALVNRKKELEEELKRIKSKL